MSDLRITHEILARALDAEGVSFHLRKTWVNDRVERIGVRVSLDSNMIEVVRSNEPEDERLSVLFALLPAEGRHVAALILRGAEQIEEAAPVSAAAVPCA